jgi:hypothetical protein
MPSEKVPAGEAVTISKIAAVAGIVSSGGTVGVLRGTRAVQRAASL